MARMVEFSKKKDLVVCSVYNHHKKSTVNDEFKICINKNKTVRHFIHMVSQHFGLDVDSFYLILKRNSTSDTRTLNDEMKLVEHDDRLLSEIGLVFSANTVNHFLLNEFDCFEDTDIAMCIVHNLKDLKMYPIEVGKDETGGKFYEKIVQLCKVDGYNTDFFLLIFDTNDKFTKCIINENETRLLSDIGVVYRNGVKNLFNVFLDVLNVKSSDIESCPSTQIQESVIQKVDSLSKCLDLSINPTKCKSVIRPETPSCIDLNCSTETMIIEYRGLVNQAMTCYLNSLLQALYMTPEFRNALYHWKFDFNEVKKEASKSITFELQQLFLKLQTSPFSSIETKKFTDSFDWNSTEFWRQQDLPEFCTYLFSALEEELKNTTHSDLLNKLYRGKLRAYVKCSECRIESSRMEEFLNLRLPIRSDRNSEAYQCLTDALNAYIQPELLEGNDQYYCLNCQKKCNAHKAIEFIKLPYILSVHLMRFDYDKICMNPIKLNDKVEFPQVLNLNSFLSNRSCLDSKEELNEIFSDELFGSNTKHDNNSCTNMDISTALDVGNENKEFDLELGNPKTDPVSSYVYELYAIMVHSGLPSGGHYFAYIKDLKTKQWFSFNDQSVTKITMDDIIKVYGERHAQENTTSRVSSTNAYMLMYRQIDNKKNRTAMSPEEFPPHLKILKNIVENQYDKDKQKKPIKSGVVVLLAAHCMESIVQRKVFICNETTTVDQLQNMAIKQFKITRPCRMVIFNKNTKEVELDLKKHMNDCVHKITLLKPCSFLLQMLDHESSITRNILMKFIMVNLDGIEEDIELNMSENIRIEQNKNIGDLSDLLYSIFNLPKETILHFVVFIEDSSKLLFVDKTIKCSSIYMNKVYVLIQHQFMERSTLVPQIISIVTRLNYTIQLLFVLSSNDTGSFINADISKNITNSVNDHSIGDDVSMKSLDDQHLEMENDSSTENSYMSTDIEDLCDTSLSSENDDLNEDNRSTDSERETKEDIKMDTSTLEYDPLKVDYTLGISDDHVCVIGDMNEHSLFTFDEKYSFKILPAQCENNGRFDAYVDKRMKIEELKNCLASHINISVDLITLYINKSNNLSELASTERTLIDLDNFDKIIISFDLRDDQYLGTIHYAQFPNNSEKNLIRLFHWIITVGTSVLDTKKQLLARLQKIHYIDIPLERLRLRKKKGHFLMKCYLNKDTWNQSIGQEWEMAVMDLEDRSEYELDNTKQLISVYFLEDTVELISETDLEFVVNIASTPSANIQLVKMISKKLNVSVNDIELGYTKDFSNFTWKSRFTNWSFYLFDDNICIFCRCIRKKRRPAKKKQQQ